MSRFSDHHEEISLGGYPKIHDKLKSIIRPEDIKDKYVMDVGACTGSFGLWAMANGARFVIINEPDANYLNRAKQYTATHAQIHGFDKSKVAFETTKMDYETDMPYAVQTLIARRFFYLLSNPNAAINFVRALKTTGCTVVYLQGLVRVKNHKKRLWNVELEAQYFTDAGFVITDYNGNDIMRLELA